MSDPFPTTEPPHVDPPAADPPAADAPTPLARHADPSLPPMSAERIRPRGGSVEWVRPAELHRRAATRAASVGLDAARRVAEARSQMIRGGVSLARSGVTRARDVLADRAAQLDGGEIPGSVAPEAPSREGPRL